MTVEPKDIQNDDVAKTPESGDATPVSNDDLKVDLTPNIDQDKLAAFEKWQAQQAREEKRQELLKPLGGIDGYNSAIEKIRSAGNTEFLQQINTELGDANLQATAIAKIGAFVSAMDSAKAAAPKAEEPMFDNIVPGIGDSTAATPKTASEPTVRVNETVTFDGIKDGEVKNALTKMHEKITEYNRENPNSYKTQHIVGMKAASETLNPVIQQAEAFGNYERASEAISVFKQVFADLAKLGQRNGDNTLMHLFDNAKGVTYQADKIESDIQSDPNAKLNYKQSMFGKFNIK